MAVFAMVTTLCARPLMAFADGDDTYWPEGPQINAPCAVVMEVNTGTVLYEKIHTKSIILQVSQRFSPHIWLYSTARWMRRLHSQKRR